MSRHSRIVSNIIKKNPGHRSSARSRPVSAAESIWGLPPCALPGLKPLEALGHTVEDAGNVSVAIAEQKKEGDPHAKYLKEITATCTKHAELVLKTLEAGKVPLCSAAITPWPRARSAAWPSSTAGRTSIGLIWIDAHTDINTPDTSPSGNVHGMPLARSWACGRPSWPTFTISLPR
jgi:arginase family enzyme